MLCGISATGCMAEFESHALIQTDLNEYKKIKSKTTLEGLKHFFTLYTNSHGSESDFIKMAKRYLYDKEKHGHKKANTIRIIRCAIEGCFEKNDNPIIFKFEEKTLSMQPDRTKEKTRKMMVTS
ncbi:MAG: hypothetical protein OEM21_02535 [Nitrosopumilus sp.]|nr:hypothetical protein [Nitrosopumilus sp.]